MGANDQTFGEDIKTFHPSFFQYLEIFVVPLIFFSLGLLGVDVYYLLLGVLVLEMVLLLLTWVYLATTVYVIWPDRIEIRTGVFVKRSQIIPLDEIVNITCRQTLFQKLFGIGTIFIDTAGGKPFEIDLTGVMNHEALTEYLFVLKNRGAL